MQQSNAPAKLVLPFAQSGAKNTIPTASQIGITPGAASLVDGFPPLTRTPLVAGGIPPSGLDFNGIFNLLSAINRWSVAGGRYAYDNAFATNANVGGYPKGAVVLRTDGEGGWLNTVENNLTDPEAGGAGWVPDFQYGITNVTMTNANVTLNSLQAGRPIIVISGLLTANLNLILPNYVKTWSVINKTTGAFTITVKTSAGTGVAVAQNSASEVYGDGVNIETVAASQSAVPDASTTVKGIVELATSAETITGTDTVRAVTPAGLQAKVATETALGLVELATAAEAQAFTADKFIDGAKLAAAFQGANQSLTSNGYQKLPGDLIIQWTQITIAASTTGGFTFPIAFPNNVFKVFDSAAQVNGDGNSNLFSGFTLSGGTLRNTFAGSITAQVFAIGN